MNFLVILLSSLMLGQAALASDSAVCANLLASGGYKVILRQARELGVVQSDDPVPLEQLYLKLKDAEWSAPGAFNLGYWEKHFAVENLSEPERLQFFRNSVHALYVRAASLWRIQEVRTQVGPVMHPETEAVLAALLRRGFSPWGLEDRDLTPAAAREHFRERKWMAWPWAKLAMFLSAWRESGTDLSKFWDEHADGLPADFYQWIYIALNGRREGPVCCLSEPGCMTCPHNRRWRIKKD
jgi:hypothetical protein